MLPQHASLAFDLPALEVVRLGRAPFGDRAADAERIAVCALDAVELGHAAAGSYLALSGGERQRVQFARLLAQAWPEAPACAATCLLDEPVANLDPRQQHRVLALLRALARHERAVVVVLHDLTLAATYADRVVVMREGRVLADGAPAAVCTPGVLGAAFDVDFAVLQGDDGHPIIAPRAAPGAPGERPWAARAGDGAPA
jgi:iron complex transport system ATP-binding protein